MKTKWIIEIAMIFIVAIFFVGCTSISETEDEGSEQPLTTTQIRERFIPEDMNADVIEITDPSELGSFGFGVVMPSFEIAPTMHFDGIFRITDESEPLVAHASNGLSQDMIVILKLFVNYQEVAFYVDGVAEADTEFVFFLPALHEINIAFELAIDLPAGDYSYKLTSAFFYGPHLNASEYEDLMRGMRMATNYDFIYGEGSEITLTVPHQEAGAQIEWQLAGLGIINLIEDIEHINFTTPNQDPELYTIMVAPNPLQVRRGELVELALLGNPVVMSGEGIPEVEDYVIMMMLDWQQIHPNGQPYLLFTANESGGRLVDYETFTFLAPEETGLFEFVSIMVPNPTQENSVDTFWPLEVHRFTIEVVE